MLILKGVGGKSRVLDALINTYKDNCIGIVYETNPFNISFGTFIVDADECDIKEFCEELPSLVEDNMNEGFVQMVVVYTNLKEDEISEIKNTIKTLEEEYYCGIGIVMCRE